MKAFEKAGITELNPTGRPFDPEQHEAMVAQPSAEHPANTVLQTIQKGYVLNGRVLRPARVIVSRAPGAEAGSRAWVKRSRQVRKRRQFRSVTIRHPGCPAPGMRSKPATQAAVADRIRSGSVQPSLS